MRYYSTRNKSKGVPFATAALQGLAKDGGLFIPEELPRYRPSVLESLHSMNFFDIAFETIAPFVKNEIPCAALNDIITSAFNFPAPLTAVGDRLVLELFHGPTAAFKDFGARFMARAFSYLRRGESKALTILVATSGDTGGAVASGFFGVEGISVTVLYPKGRVSPLQERQIAGLGGNIRALAVEGSFDDCQRLVKTAFANETIRRSLDLSSANSINIARLIPQMVYHASSAARLPREGKETVLCVPSGNFGNLTAGLYAMNMGAPIGRFIAATNINKTFPEYLSSGIYKPRDSERTISNAMDVGAPSNFERITAHWSYDELKRFLLSLYVSDEDTRRAISEVYNNYGYILEPHGAVGWFAVDLLAGQGLLDMAQTVILETAHPSKFAETVEPITGPVQMPPQLAASAGHRIQSRTIPAKDDALEEVLLTNAG